MGVLLLLAGSHAAGQAGAPSGGPRFAITGYAVENNTLLSPALIERQLAPFTGPEKDFGAVQQALEALERLYADAGYSVVQVQLPEQELTSGVVRFRVLEGRLMSVRYEGNRHFSDANVGHSLTALQPGNSPNVHELANNLRMINENPAKQTVVTLKAGREPGEVDAVARTTDQDPVRYALTLDNTGTRNTGVFRMGLAAQHANVFDRDHVMSVQYITSPDNHHRQVAILGAGYQVPLYQLNGSVGVFYGSSNVDAGRVESAAGNYMISGRGTVFGLRYTHNLEKRGNWENSLAAGYDFRAYQAHVVPVGGTATLVPDVTVHPLSLAYLASYRQPDLDFSGYFSVVHNLPGGSDGNDAAFQQAGQRPGANSRYVLYRYGLNLARALPGEWQIRAAFSGQHTAQLLISGEQFGVGGAESVRGYLERELASDKGHRGSLEVHTPDWSGILAESLRIRGLAFYDFGYVKRIRPAAQEAHGAAVSSVGIGLRGAIGKSFGLRLDFARVMDRGNDQTRGMRMHGAMSYVF